MKLRGANAEHGTRAEQFTDDAHGKQRGGEAHAHSKTVYDARQHGIFAGEHFRTAQNDAVDNDERAGTRRATCCRAGTGLMEQLHDSNKTKNNGVMYAGMRTLSGMIFLRREITALEHTSTNVVAGRSMLMASAAVVTASIAQVPSIRRSTGFSLIMPFVNSSLRLLPRRYAPSFTVVVLRWLATAPVTARLRMDAPVMADLGRPTAPYSSQA